MENTPPNASARGAFARARKQTGILGLGMSLLLMAASPIWAHEFKAGQLEIVHPWSKEAPAAATVRGGFFVVKNNGDTEDRLVAVSSPVSGKTEIHEMAVTDGVMTMRPIEGGIAIPAHGQLELKPGGLHVMFMDLKTLTPKGEKFAGTLTFEKAGKVDVEFVVQAMGDGKAMDAHAEGTSGMSEMGGHEAAPAEHGHTDQSKAHGG